MLGITMSAFASIKAQFRYQFLNELAYRARMTIWFLVDVIQLAMFPLIWLATLGESETLAGYGQKEIVTHFLLVFVVSSIVQFHGMFWIARDIRDGTMTRYLVRPIAYLRFINIGSFSSLKPFITIPFFVVIALILHRYVAAPASWWELALGVIAMIVAALMARSVSNIFGLTAFWLEDVRAVANINWALMFVFGGAFAPIAFLPDVMQTIALWLPYRYLWSFPVELYLGQLHPTQIAQGFAMLCVLAIGLASVVHIMWRRGVRRYSAVGG